MNRFKLHPFICLALAMTIVGSSVVFGKVITQSFPLFLASGLRFAIASLCLVPILHFQEKKLFRPGRQDLVLLVLMAFCGQVVFTVFVLWGLRYTSAVEAGLITSTSPAMMALAAFAFFREKPGKLHWLSIGLAIAAVVIINGVLAKESTPGGSHRFFGNFLMVVAVAGEAFFLLMRKRISAQISDLALTTYLCLAGFIMFLPFAAYQMLSFDFNRVSGAAWGAMLYFGAVFTVLAYLFWFKGVSQVTGSIAGIFTAIMPVSAVVLSAVFLKEAVNAHHIVGGGLVLVSILVISWQDRLETSVK